ncbi:MAG TPA: hypothetical protein VG537_08790 [Candidatus Kapabacteria bacterium]|nr:hypothetical protein [Candidatus Kapabacteria bacterium]
MSDDHSAVPIQIDRSKLTVDTSSATVHIISNAYGEDSILIRAFK